MMSKQAIHSDDAPAAIGTYSQAIRVGDLVFLSGQIPLDAATMEVVDGDFEVFRQAVPCARSGRCCFSTQGCRRRSGCNPRPVSSNHL